MVRVEFLNCIVISAVIIVQINASAATDRDSFDQQSAYSDLNFLTRRRITAARTCDAEDIEYKLTRFEVKLEENSDRLISEFRDTNRRLRALEDQDSEVETALKGFRTEIGRCSDLCPPSQSRHEDDQQQVIEQLESRVDNLVKEVKLVVAALKILNSDIAVVTSSIARHYEDLPSKQFLIKSLSEINQCQRYPSIPNTTFNIPKIELPTSRIPRSCKEIMINGGRGSAFHQIQPEHANEPFLVNCEMDLYNGGWTQIHSRYDGTVDFFLNWHEYKVGFGNPDSEFWLGLEYIHQLTGYENTELLVELTDGNNTKAYAYYANFGVGSEAEGYALKVLGGYRGNAGDSLSYHAGSRFSTKDYDQDNWLEGHCAKDHTGAWWYNGCDSSNLNGQYLKGYYVSQSNIYLGMYWADFRGPLYSLAQARMMVR